MERAFSIEKTPLSIHYSDMRGYTSAMDHQSINKKREVYESEEREAVQEAQDLAQRPGMKVIFLYGWGMPSRGAIPRGVVYEWDASLPVDVESFGYPMSHSGMGMFSGFTIVELDARGEDMKLMHASEFEAFRDALNASYAQLCVGETEDYDRDIEAHGLLLKGDTMDVMRSMYVSEFYPADSLLSPWDARITSDGWSKGEEVASGRFRPLLDTHRSRDFVGIYRGDSAHLPAERRAEKGVGPQDHTYYMVIFWEPPQHLTDQLLHVFGTSEGKPWGRALECPEMSRMATLSERSRERLLMQACKISGARPLISRSSEGRCKFMHTTSNTIKKRGEKVVFYSECSNSTEEGGTVASYTSLSAGEPPESILWIQGKYQPYVEGGLPWTMDLSRDGIPIDAALNTVLDGEWIKHVRASAGANLPKSYGHMKLVRV